MPTISGIRRECTSCRAIAHVRTGFGRGGIVEATRRCEIWIADQRITEVRARGHCGTVHAQIGRRARWILKYDLLAGTVARRARDRAERDTKRILPLLDAGIAGA